jgi:hypothetical protein
VGEARREKEIIMNSRSMDFQLEVAVLPVHKRPFYYNEIVDILALLLTPSCRQIEGTSWQLAAI